MADPGWLLVVEQGEVWTASIRAAATRLLPSDQRPRVRRLPAVPRLDELDSRWPLFAAIEVRRETVLADLAWMRQASRLPMVDFAALVDRNCGDATPASLAAMEAGALLAVHSPRHAPRVVLSAVRALSIAAAESGAGLSSSERALRRLPWQPEPWPVG